LKVEKNLKLQIDDYLIEKYEVFHEMMTDYETS